MILVAVFLLVREGRNFMVRSTMEVKLVETSEWNSDRLTFSGCARLIGVWTPAFKKTQSKSGYVCVILGCLSEHETPETLECILLVDESIHTAPVIDVKSLSASLILAVFLDEAVKSLLSTTNGNNLRAFLDETVSESGTDATRRADHKDLFVLERHFLRIGVTCGFLIVLKGFGPKD